MTPVRPRLQKDIVNMIAEGYLVKEVAEKLGYTHSSVETFLLRIRREYGAKNITHLVHIWHKNKMI